MKDMLNKTLAAIGVDGVHIDARLDNDVVHIGDEITGVLHVEGGRAEQGVRELEAVLACEAVTEEDDSKVVRTVPITGVRVGDSFDIQPGETREIPFAIQVPVGTPVDVPLRSAKSSSYVLSAADVALARDPQDLDRVTVRPTPLHDDVREAMESLGFRFKEGEVEWTRHGPVQEFEFVPLSRGGRYDEVEIAFIPEQGGYALMIETDLSASTGLGLLSSVLDVDLDESKRVFRVEGGVQGPGRERIEQLLRSHLSG